MTTKISSKLVLILLAAIMLFGTACASLLPPNIPVTGKPTFTSLPPFPSATATQPVGTAVGTVTVVVTATPVPSTATSAPPTATQPAPAGCDYLATFLGDVTIPDGTILKAGSSYVKTWLIRNDGSCAWGPGQKLDRLTFAGGHAMSGPASVAIPQVVQPGGMIDLSVSLVAPASAGSYVGEYMLQTTGGAFIGVGPNRAGRLTVEIVVGATPTPKPDPNNCEYKAAFIADVTFPDNFVIAPDEYITKIWRVKNTGTCAWGPSGQGPKNVDRLIFTGGILLGASPYVMLPDDGIVVPGETFDMRVNMQTPLQPGVYRSEWLFGNAVAAWLGVGADGGHPLYVQIVVKDTTVPMPSDVVELSFGPGDTQTSFSVAITPDDPQGYELRVMGGQEMIISATGGLSVGVLDANFSPLGLVNSRLGEWVARIPKTGDYIVVLYGSGSSDVVIKIPPL